MDAAADADSRVTSVSYWELELWRDVVTVALQEMLDTEATQMYGYFAESTRVGLAKVRDQITDYVGEA